MYKNKDGKVIASLTEVKNKTGDIFAIVDEFGEISLTSYNKIRYKIIKVDIENIVDIDDNGPEVKVATEDKKRTSTPKLETREEAIEMQKKEKEVEVTIEESKEEEAAAEPSKDEEQTNPTALFNKIIEIQEWDREGKSERQFSLNAIRPLIS